MLHLVLLMDQFAVCAGLISDFVVLFLDNPSQKTRFGSIEFWGKEALER